MQKYVKTIFLVMVLSLVFNIPCLAKVIKSSDGRACFITSDYWYRTSVNDSVTLEILTIGYGRDTIISLKRSKHRLGFRNFSDCSYAQKSAMREEFINSSVANLRKQGFFITLDSTNIFDSIITASYTLTKDRKMYHATESYVVKDYYCYCLTSFYTEATLFEAGDVMLSFTIDGKNWSDWAKQ